MPNTSDTDATAVSPKVTATAATGAITVILIYALQAGLGIEVPLVVETALPVVLATIAGYLRGDPLRQLGARVAARNTPGNHEA